MPIARSKIHQREQSVCADRSGGLIKAECKGTAGDVATPSKKVNRGRDTEKSRRGGNLQARHSAWELECDIVSNGM